jgi:SNF2 family DNA or RNA helicase
VSKAALYKRICNGTPVTKGVENLYAQFKFLDPLILGYDSFTTFKAQYCWIKALDRGAHEQGHGQEMIVGYKNIQELANTVDGHSHRVLKKDCLDLPDKVYKKHYFEMTPSQALAYETVRKAALQELQEVFGDEHGRKLALEIALTRLIRLQQIVCGWVPFSKGDVPIQLAGGNPRMSALLTLLSHVDEKAIIWVTAPNSVVDISFIAANLKKERLGKFVQYHGGISDDDRRKAIYDFQNDKSVKWFLASKAAYRGLTLTAADQAFYYTNNFDLGVRLQSEDRNHRIGSEIHESITYTDIYTSGIDKKIVNSLRNKKSIADQITMDPRTLFME